MNPQRQGRRPERDWIAGFERRGRPQTTETERGEIRAWLIGHLADGWFIGEPQVRVDDYEIVVVGELPGLDTTVEEAGARGVAEAARIERFREDTRERRIQIALLAEERFSRKVSWGASIGETKVLFTTANVPVMTRLDFSRRQTLDTLVEAGVTRSRSEALGWCVELVARNEHEWIERLSSALDAVKEARAEGPSSGA